MHSNEIQDILDLSNLLTTGKPAAEVIADLIEWRDASLGTVAVTVNVPKGNPEPVVEAPKPTKAPAKAAPKGRAKPPPPPADDDDNEPSSDPSDDADF